MNWNRISLFKLPKEYNRFDYIPRYYDPRKEELQRKITAANATQGDDEKVNRDISFRSKTQDRWGNPDFKTEAFRSNIRLIIILGIILAVFYYLFIGLDIAGSAIDSFKK